MEKHVYSYYFTILGQIFLLDLSISLKKKTLHNDQSNLTTDYLAFWRTNHWSKVGVRQNT